MANSLRPSDFTNQWNQLPTEVQIAIMEQVVLYLDHGGLKQMRTSGKLFSRPATATLFHTLHLTPNLQSFNRAEQIAQSPRLAGCVREIDLHRSGLIDHPDLKIGFEYFHAHHQGFHRDSTVFDRQKMTARVWHSYLKQRAAQREFMCTDWVGLLRGLCAKLPNLKSIKVAPELHMTRPSFRPNINGRQIGQEEPCLRAFGMPNVLKAAEQVYLTRLEIGDLSWVELQRLPSTPLATQFSRLRKFKLSLNSCEYQAHQSGQILAAWDSVLEACSGTREFDLDFKQTPLIHLRSHLATFMDRLTSRRFPQLQHLVLRSVYMRQQGFEHFLQNHSHTLKTLELHGWEIPWSEIGHQSGSLIRTFCFMEQYLNLQYFLLSGDFSNTFDEAWIAKKSTDRYCIRRQIEDFMCHRASFPFDEIPDLECVSKQADVVCNHLQQLQSFSDSSWRFCKELIH